MKKKLLKASSSGSVLKPSGTLKKSAPKETIVAGKLTRSVSKLSTASKGSKASVAKKKTALPADMTSLKK